jgi:hypothetical protein
MINKCKLFFMASKINNKVDDYQVQNVYVEISGKQSGQKFDKFN